MEYILLSVIDVVVQLVQWVVRFFINCLITPMTADDSLFMAYFPAIKNYFVYIQAIGVLIAIGIFVFQTIKSMFYKAASSATDSVAMMLIKLVIVIGLIFGSVQLINWTTQLCTIPATAAGLYSDDYDDIDLTGQLFENMTTCIEQTAKSYEENAVKATAEHIVNSSVAGSFTAFEGVIIVIALLFVGWKMIKFLLEILERYVLLNVLLLLCPLAIGTSISRSTVSIIRKYIEMVLSSFLLVFLNLMMLRLVFAAMSIAFSTDTMSTVLSNGQTPNALLSVFIIGAMLTVAGNMDKHLSKLIVTGSTGSEISRDLMIAGRELSGLGHLIGRAGKGGAGSQGTGKSSSLGESVKAGAAPINVDGGSGVTGHSDKGSSSLSGARGIADSYNSEGFKRGFCGEDGKVDAAKATHNLGRTMSFGNSDPAVANALNGMASASKISADEKGRSLSEQLKQQNLSPQDKKSINNELRSLKQGSNLSPLGQELQKRPDRVATAAAVSRNLGGAIGLDPKDIGVKSELQFKNNGDINSQFRKGDQLYNLDFTSRQVSPEMINDGINSGTKFKTGIEGLYASANGDDAFVSDQLRVSDFKEAGLDSNYDRLNGYFDTNGGELLGDSYHSGSSYSLETDYDHGCFGLYENGDRIGDFGYGNINDPNGEMIEGLSFSGNDGYDRPVQYYALGDDGIQNTVFEEVSSFNQVDVNNQIDEIGTKAYSSDFDQLFEEYTSNKQDSIPENNENYYFVDNLYGSEEKVQNTNAHLTYSEGEIDGKN